MRSVFSNMPQQDATCGEFSKAALRPPVDITSVNPWMQNKYKIWIELKKLNIINCQTNISVLLCLTTYIYIRSGTPVNAHTSSRNRI